MGFASLPGELDRIDASLLGAALSVRRVRVRTAHCNRGHGIPVMQPDRIGVALRRTAEHAPAHDIDRGFMHRLYNLIISETYGVGDLMVKNAKRC